MGVIKMSDDNGRIRLDSSGQLWAEEVGKMVAKWCKNDLSEPCGPHCAAMRESKYGEGYITLICFCTSPTLTTYQCKKENFVDEREER